MATRVAISTAEIAEALRLHPNGVRRHLDRLAASGLVERRRTRGLRGRPGDLWAIAPAARLGGVRPSAYASLATWLARAIQDPDRGIEETGHEIGRELAPDHSGEASEAFGDLLSALGFQPKFEAHDDGGFTCKLMNCPYRESARGFQDVICTLHRGITTGLLSELDDELRLEEFDPRDPVEAGCVISVGGERSDAERP